MIDNANRVPDLDWIPAKDALDQPTGKDVVSEDGFGHSLIGPARLRLTGTFLGHYALVAVVPIVASGALLDARREPEPSDIGQVRPLS
jgi:hypothetical protein